MQIVPSLGFALAIAGALGVYCEFLWPGKVWPGALGSAILVFGAYSLSRYPLSGWALALLVLSALLFLLESRWQTRLIAGIAATIALADGAFALVTGPRRISPLLACCLSVVFGAVTMYLASAAKRARRNKLADL